ncbi:MAG: cell division protein FtsL [Succinivibrio sp.]|jgi:cell division protein FtsL|nr:cell division protein FtsL [Succinivibrio sp.]
MQSAAARELSFEEEEESGAEVPAGAEKSADPKAEPQVVTLKGADEAPQPLFVPGMYRRPRAPALLPTILGDLWHNALVVILALAVCALALGKVYQVQKTRSLTAELNEIAEHNDELSNEWLALLAKKQALEKQSVIRTAAMERLSMIQPKTEAEVVIRLDR